MGDAFKKPLYFQKERLKTFRNWPFKEDNKCNPAKMAEAGWYACDPENSTDLAQCFFCDKQLDGWEPEDDPWGEHRKHTTNCVFVEVGKCEEEITIREHLKLALQVDKKRLIANAEEGKSALVKSKEKLVKEYSKSRKRTR